jgi:hypothetical protein
MQRERLQAEKEQEQQARTGELTMITAAQNADDAEGVWDPQSGELIEPGMTDEDREVFIEEHLGLLGDEDEIVPEDQSRVSALGEHTVRTDGPGIGPNGVPVVFTEEEEFQDTLTEARPQVNVRPGEGEVAELEDRPRVGVGQTSRVIQRVDRSKETRIIRVNDTIDPTIGRENYHFDKGRRYVVPVHVANHLHEKGYVSSFG